MKSIFDKVKIRWVRSLLLAAAAIALYGGSTFVARKWFVHAHAQITQAFTATQIDISAAACSDSAPNCVVSSQEQKIRNTRTTRFRSDGSSSITASLPRSNQEEESRRVTLGDGTYFRTIDKLGLVTSGKGSAGGLRRIVAPSEGCANAKLSELFVKSAVLLDRTVDFVQANIRVANGRALKILRWRDPDLGCFELQTFRYEERKDGTELLLSKTLTTNLVLGDPPDELFQKPAEAQEVPPSALDRAWAAHINYVIPPEVYKDYEPADQAYEKARNKLGK